MNLLTIPFPLSLIFLQIATESNRGLSLTCLLNHKKFLHTSLSNEETTSGDKEAEDSISEPILMGNLLSLSF